MNPLNVSSTRPTETARLFKGTSLQSAVPAIGRMFLTSPRDSARREWARLKRRPTRGNANARRRERKSPSLTQLQPYSTQLFYLQSQAAKGPEHGQAMEEKRIKTGSWTFKSHKSDKSHKTTVWMLRGLISSDANKRWLTINASRHAAVKGIIKGIVPPTALFLAVALVPS